MNETKLGAARNYDITQLRAIQAEDLAIRKEDEAAH